ncbi:A24 family peptidase [Haliea sp.]|uniref:prepilin peptidase n=1 Tax=Haliea sp. TaxID=1932666 RepID=UPI0035276918
MLDVFLAQPGWLASCLLLLGLVVGSFLNVVVYRLPLMMQAQWRRECCELLAQPVAEAAPLSLAAPNSHCPHCKAPVRPWQNIPVISYLLLRGRCAGCRARISPRYPVVEAATGLVTLWLGVHYGPGWQLAGAVLLTWALITLTLIDFDTQLLPDDITLPLLWLGLAFNLSGTFVPITDAVLGAIAGYGILWSVYWLFKLATGKEGMGYGDFKLLAALGAWLGWQALPLVVLLSSLVGAMVGILLIVIARRGRDIPMPFGPYLAAAGWLALIWGEPILQAWLGANGLPA